MMPAPAGSALETACTGLAEALSLCGKSAAAGAFTAIFLLFSELYPTRLRGAARRLLLLAFVVARP